MRLLIVDDDYQIREGMKYGIEWKKIGIDHVETCANGLEALSIAMEKMPDIIVADIQMPGLTGLEMMEKIRAVSSTVRVIFISAYSEFEYCRQALLLGANDYVLKPIQMSEFMEVIRKNVRELNSEMMRKKHYGEAVLEQLAREIYVGENTEKAEEFFTILVQERPLFKCDYFLTLFLSPDQKGSDKDSIREKLSSHMEDKMAVLAQIDNGFLCLAPGNNSALSTVYLQSGLRHRILEWNRIYGEKYGNLSGGISNSHGKQDLLQGYREACMLSELIFYHDRQTILLYQDGRITEKVPDSFETLEKGSGEKEVFIKIAEEAKKISLRPAVFREYLLSFYGKLSRKYHWADDMVPARKELFSCQYAGDCVKKLSERVEAHLWKTEENMHDSAEYSHMVTLAMEYVRNHYAEQIAVGDVAAYVNKSPNYFSSTFKKETGHSFTRYLNGVRLERARWLLLYTNKPVSEICREVGYTDYIYFSQLFRQQFQCSASEIRKQKK